MTVHAFTLRERSTPSSRADATPYSLHPSIGDPDGTLPAKWFSGDPLTPAGASSLSSFLTSGLDILVLAMPLTASTHHVISRPQLELLKPKCTFLSNVGRGPLVNTPDLIMALNEGWIRGAALDVTDPEPLPADHELWTTKNVIITPHVSGNSNSYNKRVLGVLEGNLGRLSRGEALGNVVKRDIGY